jgi:hypothetical protein
LPFLADVDALAEIKEADAADAAGQSCGVDAARQLLR